jgi:hypothetical protein
LLKTPRLKIALLFVVPFFAACDYYEYEINEAYSLCAVDVWESLMLCHVSEDGSRLMKLEPAIAAVGHNETWISLRQCLDGKESYYSVDAHATIGYDDPVYKGPFDYEEWLVEAVADPERWPPFVETFKKNVDKHCSRRSGGQ